MCTDATSSSYREVLMRRFCMEDKGESQRAYEDSPVHSPAKGPRDLAERTFPASGTSRGEQILPDAAQLPPLRRWSR